MTELDLLAVLTRIEESIALLRLNASDRAALTPIVPALAGAVGGEVFTAADALEYSAVACVAEMSASAFGALLARWADSGVTLEDFTIARAGRDNNTYLWQLRFSPDGATPPDARSRTA